MTNSPQQILSAVLLIGLNLLTGCGEAEPQVSDAAADELLNSAMTQTPFIADGITTPELLDGGADALPGDAKVIGVICGDMVRAYAIRSMSGASTHVVNDKFDNQPISITYCDRTDCARVMTLPENGGDSQEEIALQTGGFSGGEMLLRLNQVMYPQSSPDIPLVDYEFELTTWQEWQTAHPESKLFDMQEPKRNEATSKE